MKLHNTDTKFEFPDLPSKGENSLHIEVRLVDVVVLEASGEGLYGFISLDLFQALQDFKNCIQPEYIEAVTPPNLS